MSDINEESKPMLEERHVIERRGELGGKSYVRTPSGMMEKQVRINFCDQCGWPSKEFVICHQCGNKLCTNNGCFVFFRNRCVCVDCLQQALPVSRKDFQVLVAVFNGLKSPSQMTKLTNLSGKEVRSSFAHLEEIGAIRREGLSIFERICMTDEGVEALEAYTIVYKDIFPRSPLNSPTLLNRGVKQ